MNFCVDCLHYREPNMQCARPTPADSVNPVTGKPYTRSPNDAEWERTREHRPPPNDVCGMDAKYFSDRQYTIRYLGEVKGNSIVRRENPYD